MFVAYCEWHGTRARHATVRLSFRTARPGHVFRVGYDRLKEGGMLGSPSLQFDEWVRRFAIRFKELQPMTSEVQALEVASAAFPTSADLDPEDAAVVFSEIVDASVPLNELNRKLR